jgi:uroporphyrinogen-III decarboxylase
MEMNSHDRILAALRGEPVDRLPWCPLLAYWWDAQPEDFQKRGELAFLLDIGADAFMRGYLTPFTCSDLLGIGGYASFSEELPGVQFRREEQGDVWRMVFDTPVGCLTASAQYSEHGNTRFVTEHPVKRREDYQILRYIVERMVIRPNYAAVQAEIDQLGEDGLLAPLVSPFYKTPFQSLVEHFVGTEKLVYDLIDYPEEVEETLEVMNDKARQAVQIAAGSPAEAFITWEDSSTTNISPAMFSRYIAPELDRWGEILHENGKMLIHHACGHVRALLPAISKTCVDAIDSLSPPPTGNVEIWQAREKLGPEIALIGGIEPVNFLTLEMLELRAYVENLVERMGSERYILANSDSCPPGVSVEKFRLVTEIVREKTIR